MNVSFFAFLTMFCRSPNMAQSILAYNGNEIFVFNWFAFDEEGD